jgi:dephospho-CoA kinase
MLMIGLTGNVASGKSTVARQLVARGATLIDADALARRVVEPGMPAFDAIVGRWGEAVVAADGTLDRAALRERVFHDPAELEQLNGIVHPRVVQLRRELMDEARMRGDRVVVYDIPLLFERHLAEEFDRIILVDAPRAVRLERMVRDRGLSEADAMAMIAAQMPAELMRARSDYVIDNTGTLEELAERVDETWEVIEAAAATRATGPHAATAAIP